MSIAPYGMALAVSLHVLVELLILVRVLLRPQREPASRIAWVVVIIALPVAGILAYILFGEVNIGRRRVARLHKITECMPEFPPAAPGDTENLLVKVPQLYTHLFHVGQSISSFEPVGGNSAHLLTDSNTTIDAMVADIDAAKDHVNLLFYIWLPDDNGCKIVEALKRAAARGVACRAMADDLGSRIMIHTEHWKAMQNALCSAAYRGVDTTILLPARNDSWIVAAASRSQYADLLAVGVKIYEYVGSLLHTESLTLDGEITLIGSANMDRRSFELNYENNILFYDPTLTADMQQRQREYIARSNPIDSQTVAAWPITRRLWNNTIAMLGPLL